MLQLQARVDASTDGKRISLAMPYINVPRINVKEPFPMFLTPKGQIDIESILTYTAVLKILFRPNSCHDIHNNI